MNAATAIPFFSGRRGTASAAASSLVIAEGALVPFRT